MRIVKSHAEKVDRSVQAEIKAVLDAAYPVVPEASFNPSIADLLSQLDRTAQGKWPRF